MPRLVVLPMAALLGLAACVPASNHAQDVAAGRDAGDRLTLGIVQREIREGMTASDVASVLGAPNIVTSNPGGGETWVYDRISTEQVYSQTVGGVGVLFLAGARAGAGAASTSQRSLTVIVKFDASGRVSDFSYRQSSF